MTGKWQYLTEEFESTFVLRSSMKELLLSPGMQTFCNFSIYFWFMTSDYIDWFSFTISRSFKAISIQEQPDKTPVSNLSPEVRDLPFYQACKEQTPIPGRIFHSEIKTGPSGKMPKYVDLVKRHGRTRSISIPGPSACSSHTELIKTYRYDKYPVLRTEFCSSRYYPSWPFTTPYRQHSAFSNGPINRRHTIKK